MKKRIHKSWRMARYIAYKETLINKKEHFWTFAGSFIGIALIGLVHSNQFTSNDTLFLIGSFGASSVLLYGLINSPLAQPRNLIGGHLISATIGVTVQILIPEITWLAAATSVALSIVLMQITKTLHPPGGATALIATIGSEKVKNLGYFFVLSPVFTGVIILFLVALLFNNITNSRNYPQNKNWYRLWDRRYR